MEPENFQVETIIFRFHVKLWEGTVNRHFCRNHLQILQNTIPFKGHSDGITVVSWQGPLSTENWSTVLGENLGFHVLVHRLFWVSPPTKCGRGIWGVKFYQNSFGDGHRVVWKRFPSAKFWNNPHITLEIEHRMMMVAYQNPIVSNKKRVETSKETCWEPSEPFASWETRKRNPLTFTILVVQ